MRKSKCPPEISEAVRRRRIEAIKRRRAGLDKVEEYPAVADADFEESLREVKQK